MLLQTTLITGLLVQRARRPRAEREVSELFGRLIAAQETERSRIARDLHDDVSQRIAALSIAMSSLKRKLLGDVDGSTTVAALSAIQRDTAALAAGVRQVSHDLHPSLPQHTGLVPALNALCALFGKRTAKDVQLSIANDGKGFDLANTRGRADGLGLVSIDERVRVLRGTVDVETRPGAGTLIVVRLPSRDLPRRVDATALPGQA